ncbi:MAG: TIGR03936 family radical SAM-associated protein [Candidatus Omnitrophica bacterium]|nr:TIGR03936 family radical SAM-associated protein [Candidatus Omnitrophota bacterium]MBU0879087.1 TIGR03936 family radical SAM-associated protein [Candidatus Omnitrophota bacterium]MBU0896293.1 TIGR03936 family radical SAM-associated protein [Candidatus Omnitrophota bacterium]MBU1134611.1 TIGR03936 family radical SAM-associated protein [Candidatus Omnitrophota bacterium]MBU1366530.1 TIGR03936 family radical SAM-associated protein [Candidatus Omnitrophota bacterium]
MEINKFPLKIILYKKDEMIYFSQLDLVRILERALRRSNLPLVFTQGFNPRVKMSFSSALKLGVEGRVEVIFYFSQKISPYKLKEQLLSQLPAGLEIIECVE